MYKPIRPMILLSLLYPALALAQSVNLENAIHRAITDRPMIQASQARSQSAENAVRESRSRYLPRVNFSETFNMTNEPGGSLFTALNQERNVMSPGSGYNLVNPETQHDFESRLTLEQTIFDADTRYQIKGAEKRFESAQTRTLWSQEVAGFSAFQSYLGVQNSLAELQVVKTGEEEAREMLRLAKERYLAGVGLKADELRATVFRSEAERRALIARNNLTIARRRLALAIGQEDGEVEISAPLDPSIFSFTPAAAATERADLQAAALDVEALAIAGKQSQAAYLPRLDFSASYGLHNEASPFGADGQAWRVGAALNWEIFDGFRRNATIARVAAEKSVAIAELSEARREQHFRQAEVQLRVEEARAHKESAAATVDAALEGQRLLQKRYEAGLADLVELLSAQSALDQARSFLVTADTQLLYSLGQALLEEGRFVSTFLSNREVSQ